MHVQIITFHLKDMTEEGYLSATDFALYDDLTSSTRPGLEILAGAAS